MPVVNKPKKLAGICSTNVPIFGGYVMLALDKAQFTQIMDYLDIEQACRPGDEHFEKCLGFCTEYDSSTGAHCVVICVNDWRLDTLVHELSHAVFMICDRKGIETDSGKRETFAYLIDYLFADFYPPTTKRWQEEEDKREAAEKKAKRQKMAKENKNDPA